MKMTSRNINLFSLLACGCIALLFVKNVHSYSHKEFEFPKFSEDSESNESNEDEAAQPEIHTTAATASIRANQSPISNTNHMNGHDTHLRSYPSQDMNATEVEQRLLHEQQQNGVNTTERTDPKFVFPTDDIPGHTYKPQGSELVCNKSIFCENASYYPEDMINNVIQQNDSIKYLATVDVLPDILERFNPNEVPLCKINYQVIYPQLVKSKDKGFLIVVNQENFKQGVRIETCVNENNECSIAGSLSGGYKTSCVQKYIDRKLVAVTGNDKVDQEIFPIPSSCCCHVIFTGNAMERFGIGVKQGSSTTPVKSP